MTNVYLLAGYNKSKSSILAAARAVSELSSDHSFAGVICRDSFSIKRIKHAIRRDFSGLVKLVLGNYGIGKNCKSQELSFFIRALDDMNERSTSLRSFCIAHSIPFHSLPSPNSEAVKRIVDGRGNLAIYTGGGILKSRTISLFDRGVLNAHCGLLPNIRGMNAIEWSIITDTQLASTLHYIDAGIDTGKIIASSNLDISGTGLYQLRAQSVLKGIDLMIEYLNRAASATAPVVNNPISEGVLFRSMSNIFISITEEKLQRRCNDR